MITYDNPSDDELLLLRSTGALQDRLPNATARAAVQPVAAQAVRAAAPPPVDIDIDTSLIPGVKMALQLLTVLLALVAFMAVAFAEPRPVPVAAPAEPATALKPAGHSEPRQRAGPIAEPGVRSEQHEAAARDAGADADRGNADGGNAARDTGWGTTVLGAPPRAAALPTDAPNLLPYAAAASLALFYVVLRRVAGRHGVVRADHAAKAPVATLPAVAPVPSVATPLSAGCAATRGNVRQRMEDRVHVVVNADIVAAVVADGMGGYEHGAEAAEAASRAAAQCLAKSGQPAIECVRNTFAVAARAVAAGAREKGIAGNGAFRSTLLLAVAGRGLLAYGYVGDGSLTVVRGSDGVAVKLLSPHHDDQGALTSSLGPTGLWGTPTYGLVRLEEVDAVVVGTDGLDRCESHDELARWLVDMAVAGKTPSDGLAAALHQYANAVSEDGQWLVDDNSAVAVLIGPGVKEVKA